MQKFDHNIGFFDKKANFFAENCRKLQKIVIITSTIGMKEGRSKITIPPVNISSIKLFDIWGQVQKHLIFTAGFRK
jgi:hypothetical protein